MKSTKSVSLSLRRNQTRAFSSGYSSNMDVQAVCEWMKTLKLSKDYSMDIKTNAIDGSALELMTTRQDWNEIGIVPYGDIKKITVRIPQKSSAS